MNHGSSCINGVATVATNPRSAQQEFGALDTADKDLQLSGNQPMLHLCNLQLDNLFPQSNGLSDLKDSAVFQQNGSATFSAWENSSWVGVGNGVGQVVKPKGWNLSPQNHHALPSCKANQMNHQDLSQCQLPVAMSVSGTVPHIFNESSHILPERKINAAVDQRNPSVPLSTGTNFSNQQVNNRNTCGLNTHHNPNNTSLPFQSAAGLWSQNAPQNVRLNGFSADCPSQVPLKSGQWASNNHSCQGQSHFNFIKEKYQLEPPGGLTSGEHSSPSSCMFETCPPPSAGLSQPLHAVQDAGMSSPWKAVSHSQSPPQGSCYFQWSPSKPVVGTSTIPQEKACISPPACQVTSEVSASDAILQQYLNCNGQTQIPCLPTENSESAPFPPLVNGTVSFSETTPMHCYNY